MNTLKNKKTKNKTQNKYKFRGMGITTSVVKVSMTDKKKSKKNRTYYPRSLRIGGSTKNNDIKTLDKMGIVFLLSTTEYT